MDRGERERERAAISNIFDITDKINLTKINSKIERQVFKLKTCIWMLTYVLKFNTTDKLNKI